MTSKQLLASLGLKHYPSEADLRAFPREDREGIPVWNLERATLPALLGAMMYHARAAKPPRWREQLADQVHVELDGKMTAKMVGRCAFGMALEFCWRRSQAQELAHGKEFEKLREIINATVSKAGKSGPAYG